jgi:hypothetical protein
MDEKQIAVNVQECVDVGGKEDRSQTKTKCELGGFIPESTYPECSTE